MKCPLNLYGIRSEILSNWIFVGYTNFGRLDDGFRLTGPCTISVKNIFAQNVFMRRDNLTCSKQNCIVCAHTQIWISSYSSKGFLFIISNLLNLILGTLFRQQNWKWKCHWRKYWNIHTHTHTKLLWRCIQHTWQQNIYIVYNLFLPILFGNRNYIRIRCAWKII